MWGWKRWFKGLENKDMHFCNAGCHQSPFKLVKTEVQHFGYMWQTEGLKHSCYSSRIKCHSVLHIHFSLYLIYTFVYVKICMCVISLLFKVSRYRITAELQVGPLISGLDGRVSANNARPKPACWVNTTLSSLSNYCLFWLSEKQLS